MTSVSHQFVREYSRWQHHTLASHLQERLQAFGGTHTLFRQPGLVVPSVAGTGSPRICLAQRTLSGALADPLVAEGILGMATLATELGKRRRDAQKSPEADLSNPDMRRFEPRKISDTGFEFRSHFTIEPPMPSYRQDGRRLPTPAYPFGPALAVLQQLTVDTPLPGLAAFAVQETLQDFGTSRSIAIYRHMDPTKAHTDCAYITMQVPLRPLVDMVGMDWPRGELSGDQIAATMVALGHACFPNITCAPIQDYALLLRQTSARAYDLADRPDTWCVVEASTTHTNAPVFAAGALRAYSAHDRDHFGWPTVVVRLSYALQSAINDQPIDTLWNLGQPAWLRALSWCEAT